MKSNIPTATDAFRDKQAQIDPAAAIQLAEVIAEEFADTENLAIYVRLCRSYPPEVIKRAHHAALSVPSEKVKRSRLALFTFLVKKYAIEKE
jgi:hypothetical protein